MESMTQEIQPQQPETSTTLSPEECPTCVSGVDPFIRGSLFQEALNESL